MAENKTQENETSVERFLNSIADETRRRDCVTIMDLMRKVTGKEPKMWGSSMVGFGRYHYKYQSGREGDTFWVGFSPRKQELTLYLTYGFDQHADLMQRLGKYKTGKACLYLKKIEDVDLTALEELIRRSAEPHLKSD